MADQNERPQIPSFKPAKKDDDKKGGSLTGLGKPSGSLPAANTPPSSGIKWPSLGVKGSPNLKVRGLPGGATILDRLKNLRRKDMGFIAAGLSVLMMAPVAEHLMMSPEDAKRGDLTAGFDQKGPLFPDGTTIYENGTGGFSPGSLIGAGSDVITPLNVRDPAALVMGPGASQKPAATVTPPPPAPEKESNWKDALSQAANRGARTAVKKAKLPKPSVKMSGALRGLSALSGSSSGGGPSMKLDAPNAGGVPNRARDSGSLTRAQAIPGYQGAARRSNASSGSPESLRGAGGGQGDLFNRGGAAGALDQAAAAQMPSGGYGFGGGGPGSGSAGKGPGGNNAKDSRSLGESLAYQRAKKEQDKAIDLKWKIKEWETFGRKKMIEEAVYKSAIENLLGKGIFEPLGKALGEAIGLMNPDPAAKKGVMCYAEDRQGMTLANNANCTWRCSSNVKAMVQAKDPSKSCGASASYDCLGGCFYLPGSGTDAPPPGHSRESGAVTSPTVPGRHSGVADTRRGSDLKIQEWKPAYEALYKNADDLKLKIKADSQVKPAADAFILSVKGAADAHKAAYERHAAAKKKLGEAGQHLEAVLKALGGEANTPAGYFKTEIDVIAKAKELLVELKKDSLDLKKLRTLKGNLYQLGNDVDKLGESGDEAIKKLNEVEKSLDASQLEFKKAKELVKKATVDATNDFVNKRASVLTAIQGVKVGAEAGLEDFKKISDESAGVLSIAKSKASEAETATSAELLTLLKANAYGINAKDSLLKGTDKPEIEVTIKTEATNKQEKVKVPNVKIGGQAYSCITMKECDDKSSAKLAFELAEALSPSVPTSGNGAITDTDKKQKLEAIAKAVTAADKGMEEVRKALIAARELK